MYAALSDRRPEEERRKIVDLFYQRYTDLVLENPLDHDFGVPNGYIHIMKIVDSGILHENGLY